MMKLYLREDAVEYYREMLDVLRIFQPDFTWSEDSEGAETVWIEKIADDKEIMHIGETSLAVDQMGRETIQEIRRARATVLYRYLKERLNSRGSKWGTLTGMRPNKLVHFRLDKGEDISSVKEWLISEFTCSEEKAALLTDVAALQRGFFEPREQAVKSAGVYVDIPFCPSRCSYCTFPSFNLPKPQKMAEYLTNLKREIAAAAEAAHERGQKIKEIYIGGGTPTTLNEAELEDLLKVLQEQMGSDLVEFTVEAGRPDTLNRRKLEIMHELGVSRISINPQSMVEETLRRIGRRHTAADLEKKYYLAREVGFNNINMDLIIGLPGERGEDFAYTLAKIAEMQPENVTIHSLALKRSSRLKEEEGYKSEGAAIIEEMAAMASEWVKAEGYVPYYLYRQKHMVNNLENIGYTKPGFESLYNILMMEERQSIYGLGVGSSSKYVCSDGWCLDGDFNPRDLILYNERIEEIIQRKVDKIRSIS